MNMAEIEEINQEETSHDTEGCTQLPSVEKPRGLMQKIHNKIVGNGNFDMSKSVQPANSAYLLSRYGHSYGAAERLDNFLKELTNTIQEKNSKGEYACVKMLPDDLLEYKNGIISLFKEKGYAIGDLKDHINNVMQSYIFICWDKFDPTYESSQHSA